MKIEGIVEADKFQEFLDGFSERIDKAEKSIIDEIAEFTLNEIKSNCSKAEYQPRYRDVFL